MYKIAAIGLMVCVWASCLAFMKPPVKPSLTAQQVLKRLLEQRVKRYQLQGSASIQGAGLRRFFGKVEVDFVAQTPCFFYISLRSFFEQPAQMTAFDGECSYFVDLSNPSQIKRDVQCGVETLKQNPLLEGLSLQYISSIFLGILPEENLRFVDFFTPHSKRYGVILEQAGGTTIELHMQQSDDTITFMRIHYGKTQTVLEVEYEDFRNMADMLWAHKLKVRIKNPSGDKRFIWQIKELQVNGALLPKESFHF